MKTETIILNEQRNVSLTCYLLSVGGEFTNITKRPAVLILPGGGYQMCSEREADPIAMEYLKAGYLVFILRYSVQKYAAWANPLEDYEQAMSFVREHGNEWNIFTDKIAVIGFSAGGHLAACAATMSKNRPDAAILGYPVILKSTADIFSDASTDVVSLGDKNTYPCFVFACRDDTLVPIDNSLQFLCALSANNISFETHIYAFGEHGFSTADSSILSPETKICNRVHHWVDDSIEWLKDIFGDFGNGVMTKPVCEKHVNGNSDEWLSIDCTMGHLSQFPEASEILALLSNGNEQKNKNDMHQEVNEALNMAANMTPEQIQSMTMNMTIRGMLSLAGVPTEVLEGLNQQLNQIPNL